MNQQGGTWRAAFGICALALAASASAAPAEDGERFTHVAGIVLGHDTLAGVRAKFGAAELVSEGDAGEAVSSVCYWLPRHHRTVTFRSGELGGREREVLGVDIAGVTRPPPRCRTAELTDASTLAQLPPGLALGTRASVVAATLALPRPAGSVRELKRVFATKQADARGSHDLTVTVIGRFDSGRMAELSIDRVLTD